MGLLEGPDMECGVTWTDSSKASQACCRCLILAPQVVLCFLRHAHLQRSLAIRQAFDDDAPS